MFIFAHRGLKLKYPENTMPAFKAANELGLGIELDVRLTKDGKLVCIHDAKTEHVTGVSLFIKDTMTEELQRLKVYSRKDSNAARVGIAVFEDVARQVISEFRSGQKAAIHLKHDEQGEMQAQLLVDVFFRYTLYDKAIIFDLTFEMARKIRSMDPKIQLSLSVGEENYTPTIYTWKEAQNHLDVFDIVWWDEWKISGSIYNEQMARTIHDAGKSIYAISPELHLDHEHPHAESGYEVDWHNFIKWRVEGVCTAYPEKFKKLLETS